MKKIIFNNGSNVELAYHTSEVKFGKVKHTGNRKLSFSTMKGEVVETIEFNLDDYTDVYGCIDGSVQYLSIWEVLGERLVEADVTPDEMKTIHQAIIKFPIKLLKEDGNNDEFANELVKMFEFNGGYE